MDTQNNQNSPTESNNLMTTSVSEPSTNPIPNQNTPLAQNAPTFNPTIQNISTPPPQPNDAKALTTALKIMAIVCLILGIITILGTILTIIGLASGLFTANQGASMVSSLLVGVFYSLVRRYGSLLCIATIIVACIARSRHHIQIWKPLLVAICSLIVIRIPQIIIFIINLLSHY